MIYLIDDKKERQQIRYNIDSFDKYKDVMTIINKLDDGNISFLNHASCILLHNSFTPQSLRTIIRKKYRNTSKAYFSNKFKTTKFSDENFIEEIRTDILYQYLRYFLEAYKTTGNINLKILAFGENYKQAEVSKLKDIIYYALFDYDYETTLQADWLEEGTIKAIEELYTLAFSDNQFEQYYEQLINPNCSVGQFLNKIDALSQKIK